MAFEFGAKQRPEQQFRDELRSLSTQIESVNQQLAGGSFAGGEGGPALGKAFADVNAKLQYIYEMQKTFQTEIREEVKQSLAEVEKSVNATLKKNLADLYDAEKGAQQALETIQQRLASSPAYNLEEFSDLRKTLKLLVEIYREEVQVFRTQNEFLQSKLESIERLHTKH